jgi:L-fuconate dehydratase
VEPVTIAQGRYLAPTAPGFSARMHDTSVRDHLFPDGIVWKNAPKTAVG